MADFANEFKLALIDVNEIFATLVRTIIEEHYLYIDYDNINDENTEEDECNRLKQKLEEKYNEDKEDFYVEMINMCANGTAPIELYSFHRLIRGSLSYKKSYNFLKSHPLIMLDIIIDGLENIGCDECIPCAMKRCIKAEDARFNDFFYHYLTQAEDAHTIIDEELRNAKVIN